MCVDRSALSTRPSECGSTSSTTPSPPPSTLPPTSPPQTCAVDWGSCSSSRCCASSDFTCFAQDASYAECRRDGCPAGWACTVLTPGLPTPESCADLCGHSPTSGSCSSHADAMSCTSHFFKKGAYFMPCSWTACGECFADGAAALHCPDLDSQCANECQQLCGKIDLSISGQTCGDFSHDEKQCVRSYFSKAGKRMPCKWTDCACYADGETLLDCASLDGVCPSAFLAVA